MFPRRGHSTTAVALCPGLVDVTGFGGCPDDYNELRSPTDDTRIAETTIFTFGKWVIRYNFPGSSMILYTISLHCVLIDQVGSEWELVGVANNSQRGTGERVREKMLKISEIARDNKAEESSHANKRALEGRVKEAEAAEREERARARDADNRAELAERAAIEQEQKAQEAERRYTKAQQVWWE